MSMTDQGDTFTPLRKQLNLSGVPFQLSVERALQEIRREYKIHPILREVPAGERFLDIVCRVASNLIVLECKRVTDKDWIFVTDNIRTRNECYLEYFNGRVDRAFATRQGGDRVFVDTWLLNSDIPEAGFCVTPKGSAEQSIEGICRGLLSGCRHLLGDEDIQNEPFTVGVPVIVTTARLWLCGIREADVILETGKVPDDKGAFEAVNAIRFTKTFAERRSNFYISDRSDLDEWADDRTRTVFVLNPNAIPMFFHGLEFLFSKSGRFGPAAYLNPPTPL